MKKYNIGLWIGTLLPLLFNSYILIAILIEEFIRLPIPQIIWIAIINLIGYMFLSGLWTLKVWFKRN